MRVHTSTSLGPPESPPSGMMSRGVCVAVLYNVKECTVSPVAEGISLDSPTDCARAACRLGECCMLLCDVDDASDTAQQQAQARGSRLEARGWAPAWPGCASTCFPPIGPARVRCRHRERGGGAQASVWVVPSRGVVAALRQATALSGLPAPAASMCGDERCPARHSSLSSRARRRRGCGRGPRPGMHTERGRRRIQTDASSVVEMR